MERMSFSTDRRAVTEGEIVEVRWACPGASGVELTIDNGYKTSAIPLETSGEKRFRLHRSKGRTRLTLTATVDGKKFSKTLKIRVKEMPVTKAETVDQRGKPMSRLRQWLNMPRWQSMLMRYRQGHNALPKEKRLASRLLLLIGGVLLLSAFVPVLLFVGLFSIVCYLMWVILRR